MRKRPYSVGSYANREDSKQVFYIMSTRLGAGIQLFIASVHGRYRQSPCVLNLIPQFQSVRSDSGNAPAG